ncbi:Integrase H2C2 domain-containing protein [Aphis craccivora]|uniref:Integrase H2C2 domain-containing protein n=1 Tax=Aphis craccivora TaxID=307492 RepID=A0A6G0Y9Y4_APHCR|nr:Integrase H2C2 domain-containing protein [Aphis craccivora]
MLFIVSNVHDSNNEHLEKKRNISTKNEKSNFRKQCKPFQVENGDALSAQRGRDTTQRLIKQRYFWYQMSDDVWDFIMRCDSCQRVNPTSLKVVPELKSVEIPK